MSIIQYAVDEDSIDCAFYLYPVRNVDASDSYGLSEISQEVARDYHANHDGWECEWPVDINLWIDGVSVGTFSVERDYAPYFVAYRKDEAVKL